MMSETRVYEPPEPLGAWVVRTVRWWASFAVVAAHVAGTLLTVLTLLDAWRFRLLLQILWDRVPLLGSLQPLWLLAPLLLLAIAGLGIARSVQGVRGLLRRTQDDDALVKLRVLLYVLLGCVLFNVFVLSTPETFSGPFRVRFPVVAEISAAFAYGIFAGWILLLPRLRQRVSPRIRRAVDVVCMNVLVILTLVELTLRALALFWSSPLLVTESSPSQIRRDSERLQPGHLLFGFPINAGGHHDTPFLPREQRTRKTVVSIGDSFSYGVVPHAFHFTTVAEREGSGFEIYNMGYPGIGPADYLHLLRSDALRLRPDLLLVHVYVGNDISDSPVLAGPARWHDADSYLAAVVWYRLQILRRARKSDLGRDAAPASTDSSALAERYPWLYDPMREPASIGRDVYLQLELQNARGVATPSPGTYERFLEAMAAIAHVAGDVPIAFVLIPDEFQVEDALWSDLVRMHGDSLDRDRPQRVALEWFRRAELPVLDLLPALRAVQPLGDGARHVYHRQDTHFNARGNAVAGRAIARFVDSLLASPRRPRRPLAESVPPPPRVTLPATIDFGDTVARRWMGGWHAAEQSGGRTLAWNTGPRSVLTTALPSDRDITMSFEVLPYEYRGSRPQSIQITVNGSEVARIQLRSGLAPYTVTLPARLLRQSPQTLEFRYAYTAKPAEVASGSADIRELAVAWFSLTFSAR